MTPSKGNTAAGAKTQTKATSPDPKEISISRNRADTEICPQCRGSHYVLTNHQGHVLAELCACFKCPECEGRGHIYIEDETGISSLRECVCAGLVRRLKKVGEAGIPGKFASTKLDTYHPIHDSQKFALRQARDFVKDFGTSQQGLLFMGRSGLGKTHLAVSVIKSLILDKGAECKFVDFFQLLSDIRFGYSQDLSEQAIINPYVAAPILLIDELAKGRNTEWELTMLDQIISSRYNAADKITLFTTNYSDQTHDPKKDGKKDSHKEFGNNREALATEETLQDKVGERIYSRLAEMCRFIKLEGIDYRQEMQGKQTAPARSRPAKRRPG
ncbi:MAG: ATP-binding protein [Nitrospinota bacterium]|nr:ATP-binding protein [Nitrospinota bacterium]